MHIYAWVLSWRHGCHRIYCHSWVQSFHLSCSFWKRSSSTEASFPALTEAPSWFPPKHKRVPSWLIASFPELQTPYRSRGHIRWFNPCYLDRSDVFELVKPQRFIDLPSLPRNPHIWCSPNSASNEWLSQDGEGELDLAAWIQAFHGLSWGLETPKWDPSGEPAPTSNCTMWLTVIDIYLL